jgi:predicted nuclease of predicted toxin-antitoxin system
VKLLLDACVWGGACEELRVAGHDVIWVGDWPKDPGDEEIMAWALRRKRVLVTLDKDFGELSIVYKKKHCGIIRLVNISAREQASICLKVLSLHSADLRRGAIITVNPWKLRVRLAD